MKELIIKPIGGLGNRLLVVDSAIRNNFPVKPTIIWERNQNLNCAFAELFHYPEEITIVETEGFNKYSIKSYLEFYNAFDPSTFKWPFFNRIIGKERKCDQILYDEILTRKIEENINYLPIEGEKVYLAYHARFGPISDIIYRFKPLDQLLEKINQTIKNYDHNTIGVHIRRTDHMDAIRYSPTAPFFKLMREEIEKYNSNFFVSSDSEEEKNALLKKFGDQVGFRDSTLDRNNPAGIKDALIDMYCLSRTTKIISSFNSTFSQVAAELGQIENQIIYLP